MIVSFPQSFDFERDYESASVTGFVPPVWQGNTLPCDDEGGECTAAVWRETENRYAFGYITDNGGCIIFDKWATLFQRATRLAERVTSQACAH